MKKRRVVQMLSGVSQRMKLVADELVNEVKGQLA